MMVMMIVITKMLNGACRILTKHPVGATGFMGRTSAVAKLGIVRISQRFLICMVTRGGHGRSIGCANCGFSVSPSKAEVFRHKASRNVSTQSTQNLSQKDAHLESHKQPAGVERYGENSTEKHSSSVQPRLQENPGQMSPQSSIKTKQEASPRIANRDDKMSVNSNVTSSPGQKVEQTSDTRTTSSVDKDTSGTRSSTSLSPAQNLKGTSRKKQSGKKAEVNDKKVQKQQKSGSSSPSQKKATSTKLKPNLVSKNKIEAGKQGTEKASQKMNERSSVNLHKAKATSAKNQPSLGSKSQPGMGNQGNVTGNQTTSGHTSTNQESVITSSGKPQAHSENDTNADAGNQGVNTGNHITSHRTDTAANSSTSGQLLIQRSREVTVKSADTRIPENVQATDADVVDSMKIPHSAITNHTSAIPVVPQNNLTFKKNNYLQFKSMIFPGLSAVVRPVSGHNDVINEHTVNLPTDKILETDCEVQSLKEQTDRATRSKSVKKEKRHNWSIVKNPQAYLQPFMDVSIFCGMIQEAQALFDSARHHGQVLETEHYNTMLQAWAKKGDLKQVRSLFAQMAASQVKPDLQSYAAALECMGRMKGVDHSTVTKCLEQMESEKLSVTDIFHVCTFTNDAREVILHLLKDIRPGFEAPPPQPRPHCELSIVQDLYSDENLKVDAFSAQETPGQEQILSREKILSKLKEQMAMEKTEAVMVPSIEQENPPNDHTLSKQAILAEHRQMWRKALLAALNFEIKNMWTRNNPRRATVGKLNFYPFMSIMEPKEYVELMLEALQHVATSTEGCMTVFLSRELGQRVQRKFLIRRKIRTGVADKMLKLYKEFVCESLEASSLNQRALWQSLEDANPEGPTLNADVQGWPVTITLGLGSLLADIMAREIKINANMASIKREKRLIPALYYMYTYKNFKQVGFIKPHPALVDLLQQAKQPAMPFESNLLPMLSPPIPWTSVKFGGFPLSTTKIMRCKDGTPQHQLLLEKTKSAELHPIFDSLNQLASIPWIINKPVLDVVISVFKDGGSQALDVAQPPSVLPSIAKPTGETTQEELTELQRQRAALRKRQAEMHSLRMDMLYKLSIADKYRDEVFWFPHNMDFRGRVYPCPPHLNHMGNDVTRSILLFAKGLPLGTDGQDWLKIHLVNLTGHKKRCSLAERLEYANEMLPEIVDSAENPLEGYGWWTTADDKWQALACCMEINNVLNYHGDPSTYVSHLPVQQDGSCNGLQHYAALGRDVTGAYQVNLTNTEEPQDVYSGVAKLVEEICQKDAENDHPLAKILEGHIDRKVVKQTVMTVVYGVTMYGGKLQILKQLKERDSIPSDQMPYAAGYLVIKVFQSLRQMFTKTREIQDWLTECAWLISKAGQTVEWVTPLGLPVVQPYHKKNLRVINHADRIMYHEDRSDITERPDSMKQKNAFPPNFIHSLDSTHMMLTSLHCHKAGINFASVHDCFWTHACSVPIMNRICREEFVRLHSEEILQSLAEFLMNKYGHLNISETDRVRKVNPQLRTIGDYIIQVPQKGDFDLNNVQKSTFFFS